MARQINKIKIAEAAIEERDTDIKRLNLIIAGMKIRELEVEIAYRNEQLKFASHKIQSARDNLARLIGEV